MKKKKKILIIILSILLIFIICLLIINRKRTNHIDNKNTYNFETINLDWNEIVDIEIDGAEGYSNVVLNYNDIPELDSRVNEVLNNWENKRLEIDLTTEDAQKEYELVGKLTTFKEIQWCTLPDNWDTLSNGDELVITCGNDVLKELGYKYNKTITIPVDNLDEVVIETTSKSNLSSDARENSDYIENNDNNLNISNNSGTYTVNNDIYDVIGDDIVIYPNDMNNFELQVEDGKRVFIQVDTQTDFQKAKAYALENGNIDYIQIGGQVYDKESNFEESEEWRGASIDG